MRALVTGAAGFIAPHIARRLADAGHTVFGVDDFSNGRRENVPPGIELIVQDLSDPGGMAKLPGSIDVILHLAGQASGENSFRDPVDDLNRNTTTTINLIRYGIDAGAQRFVFASSMSCYGDVPTDHVAETEPCRPLSCYANAKLAAEGYLRILANRLPYVIFRIFNVYGPGQNLDNMRQGMISIYLAQALHDGTVKVKGSLDRFRDFIEVEDVVEAWMRAATSDRADGQTLNLGTGQGTTVRRVLEVLRQHIDGMDWYVEGSTPGDQFGLRADVSRLKSVLDFEPRIDIETGIPRFVDWARAQITTQGAL